MIEKPTKVFPCDCMGEGIVVTKLHDSEDISENEVLVEEDKELRDCQESPYINLSFWEYGHSTNNKWSWLWRLKIAWRVFKKGTPYPDMVIMKTATAKNLANHILYLIKKGKREIKREPLVKENYHIINDGLINVPECEGDSSLVEKLKGRTGKIEFLEKSNPGGMEALDPVLKELQNILEKDEPTPSEILSNQCIEKIPGPNKIKTPDDILIDQLGGSQAGSRILEETRREFDEKELIAKDAKIEIDPIGLDLIQDKKEPYPMLCFQHGGSAGCVEHNTKNGFVCPECAMILLHGNADDIINGANQD